MSDDEWFEENVPSPERIMALGFKPQKEIYLNSMLPYSDQLDEESARLFDQIKTNFAKAVMLREVKPACVIWSSRLMKYIRIYGYKFSKEDHILLVKLVYELLFIPDLEPSKIQKFAVLFVMLTKKRYLISPEELTLPWRPLSELGKNIFDRSRTHIGIYHYLTEKRDPPKEGGVFEMIRKFISGSGLSDALEMFGWNNDDDESISLETTFVSLVKCAKPYFALSATQEILDQFLPQIYPWSGETHLMSQLTIFLPVSLAPKHSGQGHELWFKEMMDLWDTCYNAHNGISEIMTLFASLAKRNPGAVDWAPYIPLMFSRFLHALRLPVSYKEMQYSRNHYIGTKQMASWIVWSISPNGLVLKHLKNFFKGIESYLHSANAGIWSYRLRDLLKKLPSEFLNRVNRENNKKFERSWENRTPEEYRLREEDITEFVEIVLEPILLAVYSRSGFRDTSTALQNLATLRPAAVIPPLLERLRAALESLTEPHRMTVALAAVSAVVRPLVRGPAAGYPAGPTHVLPLLLGALPGLDPNDVKKTLLSLHFILVTSWLVPYVDCSGAAEHWPDLTDEELLTCELTAQFEDFVLLFLDRLFGIVESSILENARLETKESDSFRSKTDSVVEVALMSTTTAVLMQCSPKIFSEALRKFKQFATTSTFETNVAGSMIGVLLRVFARVSPEPTLAAFVPQLCAELGELLESDEALRDENPPRELTYRLLLLSHVVECNGKVLIKYIPQISRVLDRALKLHAKEAITRSCDILGRIMVSFSVIELKELRSSSKDYSKAPKEWLPIREWGQGCPPREANFTWHVPDDQEIACAQSLLDKYGLPEIARLRQWLGGQRPMCNKRRLRAFYILNAVTCGTLLLPAPKEAPVQLANSLVPATSFPMASAVKRQLLLDGQNVRVFLTRLLVDVQTRMIADKSDDTRGFEMLIQVWERISGVRSSRSGPSMETRMRGYSALEKALDGRGGGPGSGRVRTLLASALRIQDDARIDLHCDAGIGPTGLQALHALYELSIHTYTSVRTLAQVRLYWMLSYNAYSYRALIPRFIELLATGGEGDEWHAKHKGVLFIMLGPTSAGPLVAKQDWETVKLLWPAILKAPLSEKPSILKLEQVFSETLHRQFSAVNTRLTMSESCIEAAKLLLTDEKLTEKEFVELYNKAEDIERQISDANEKHYKELVEELVRIAETPNIQWRRLELVMQLLVYCPSVQTPYPPCALKLIVNSLIHDDIAVRRTAIKLTHFALKQRKHKIKKITVDPYEVAGVPKPEKRVPGYRKDNEWAIWSESRIPKTDDEWDRPWLKTFVYGFYAWPDKLEVAAPYSEQVPVDRSPQSMEEGERHIYEFFADDHNVNKLISFMTVEEKKGKDKFNGSRYSMLRVLFRSYGPRIADKFLSRAVQLAGESNEASQRFAAEVAAAAIRAPRYWDRQNAMRTYQKAVEVVQVGLNAVTPETLEDWGTCVASGVEKLCPQRGAFVLAALIDACAPSAAAQADTDQKSSFGVCAKLYALQGALESMSWRAAPIAAQVLEKLQASMFIQHPYQNVRESVGTLLSSIFHTELVFPGGSSGPAPRLDHFLADVRPKLAALYDENGEIVVKRLSMPFSGAVVGAPCAGALAPPRARPDALPPLDMARLDGNNDVNDEQQAHAGDDDRSESTDGDSVSLVEVGDKALVSRLETALQLGGDCATGPREHARAVNLLSTVFRACMVLTVRGLNGSTVAQYSLVPIACGLATRGVPQPNDELGVSADAFLASLAMCHHGEEAFDVALETLEQVSTSRSWWSRLACVELAQPLLFYGLPQLCARPPRAQRAERLALTLMRDQRLEVRQAAAKLLTGLMHCQALPDENVTMKKLIKSCRSKEIVERHYGVLGLCAYIASRPYSLGPRLGVVLEELSRHTNAPDPVPAAIRTTLADFRRTHQDDWPKHREALTEQELDLLADLTSPPSYCA